MLQRPNPVLEMLNPLCLLLWSSIWRQCGTGAVLGRWSTLFNPSVERQQMFDYVSGCAVAVNSRRFRWVCLAFSFAFARDHIGQIDCPCLEKLIERRGEAASITPPRQTDTIVSAECKPAQSTSV